MSPPWISIGTILACEWNRLDMVSDVSSADHSLWDGSQTAADDASPAGDRVAGYGTGVATVGVP